MYDLRVCMYICIQIWTHFHCDSGWKSPTCIEVANASVHQDLALRWARRCRRQSAKEKTSRWKNVSLSAFSPSCRSWIITASWTRPLRPKKPCACRSSLWFCVAAVNWAGWFHRPQAIPDLQQLLICKSRPENIYIYMCIYFCVEASVCHTIMSKYVLTLRSKRQACGVGCCRWKNAAQNGAWQKLPLALQKRCKEVPGWSSATGSHERVWPRFVFSLYIYINMCATHALCHWRASLGLRTQSFAHADAR